MSSFFTSYLITNTSQHQHQHPGSMHAMPCHHLQKDTTKPECLLSYSYSSSNTRSYHHLNNNTSSTPHSPETKNTPSINIYICNTSNNTGLAASSFLNANSNKKLIKIQLPRLHHLQQPCSLLLRPVVPPERGGGGLGAREVGEAEAGEAGPEGGDLARAAERRLRVHTPPEHHLG